MEIYVLLSEALRRRGAGACDRIWTGVSRGFLRTSSHFSSGDGSGAPGGLVPQGEGVG